MSAGSKIEWTDHSFNPWWGCIRVSAGCEHCYAETFARRLGHHVWGPEQTTARRFFGDAHWAEPRRWNAQAEREGVRRRVFCASMADVFEDRRDLDEPRLRVLALIEATPSLDWLLLTKRADHMARFFAAHTALVHQITTPEERNWPLPNLWLGVSVENQAAADARIPLLLQTPAAVRFLSCEPLLGPLDLSPWVQPERIVTDPSSPDYGRTYCGINWVICGGESGGPVERRLVYSGALQRIDGQWVCSAHTCGRLLRPEEIAAHRWHPTGVALKWLRSLRDQCQAAGVSFFLKQWGGPNPKSGGRLLDGREWSQFPGEGEIA